MSLGRYCFVHLRINYFLCCMGESFMYMFESLCSTRGSSKTKFVNSRSGTDNDILILPCSWNYACVRNPRMSSRPRSYCWRVYSFLKSGREMICKRERGFVLLGRGLGMQRVALLSRIIRHPGYMSCSAARP
jgi:hypothetical protein